MGAFEEMKGKAKETAGRVAGDPDMVREGQAQQDKGEAQREAAEAQAQAKQEERQQERAQQQ